MESLERRCLDAAVVRLCLNNADMSMRSNGGDGGGGIDDVIETRSTRLGLLPTKSARSSAYGLSASSENDWLRGNGAKMSHSTRDGANIRET